jgi:UDP-N-acetylmuramoyl-L-alanyl-D-glutamate--2,6-diaminopimelate ligase
MSALTMAESTLGEMFGERAPSAASALRVSGIGLDSRTLQRGALFVACAGGRKHGLDYLDDALARGAAAVAWEPVPGIAPPRDVPVTCFAVPGLRQSLGELADRFYAKPSADVSVVGITGTNGKTTCAWLFANALQALGQRCGLMGTLGYGFSDDLQQQDLTTPDVVAVHRRLDELRSAGASAVVMEVSSHALDQGRVDGVRFAAAAFTNLSRDHLDYHGDLESYGAAKAALFLSASQGAAIINIDDDHGAALFARLPRSVQRISVSAHGHRAEDGSGYVYATRIASHDRGLRIEFESGWGAATLESRLLGAFNAENLLIVAALLLQRGIALPDALAALSSVGAPPGRMETFAGHAGTTAIVDYAHTPDALEKVLVALRGHGSGRLVCVFGAGGDRDRGKRRQMGEVAARLADRIVLTDDNPRSESPAQIVADIRAGIGGDVEVTVIHDRELAIRTALDGAAPGDLVLIAGKGHEQTQLGAGGSRQFSDRDAVQRWLERTA